MAGINNKYDYRDGVLTALGVEHTPSDIRNEDEYRKKVLDGFGVEYTDDDINRKSLYREKVVSGLASGGGGGGGSSDFRTAVLTIINTRANPVRCEVPCYRDDAEVASTRAFTFGASGDEPTTATVNVICKTNGATLAIATTGVTATTSGNIQYIEEENAYLITGDCTITIS